MGYIIYWICKYIYMLMSYIKLKSFMHIYNGDSSTLRTTINGGFAKNKRIIH